MIDTPTYIASQLSLHSFLSLERKRVSPKRKRVLPPQFATVIPVMLCQVLRSTS